MLRYNRQHGLFVYDVNQKTIFALDEDGQVTQEFGGEGRGPGEFLEMRNMFLTDRYLYAIDRAQFRLSRFTYDGEPDGYMDYSPKNASALPPAAPIASEPRGKYMENQSAVMHDGHILVPRVRPNEKIEQLYQVIDWKGMRKLNWETYLKEPDSKKITTGMNRL